LTGLLAFFAESTFIALWMFGRNRLPPLAHTLSISVVSLDTIASAFSILTANAWMQHPVGYRIVENKAGLTDFWAVLRNETLWAEFSHTVLAAFVTGAMVVLGVSGWQLLWGRQVEAFTRSARLAAGVALVCTVLVMVTGDLQARQMDTSSQPGSGERPGQGSSSAVGAPVRLGKWGSRPGRRGAPGIGRGREPRWELHGRTPSRFSELT
jgi:cytochrome d ubiquinol oxidase subunit I